MLLADHIRLIDTSPTSNQCCIVEDTTAEAGNAAADSAIDNGRRRSIW